MDWFEIINHRVQIYIKNFILFIHVLEINLVVIILARNRDSSIDFFYQSIFMYLLIITFKFNKIIITYLFRNQFIVTNIFKNKKLFTKIQFQFVFLFTRIHSVDFIYQ